MKSGSLGKRSKIPVSGQQRNPLINATLGYESIAETGFALLCQNLCSKRACSLPIARLYIHEGQASQRFRNCRG